MGCDVSRISVCYWRTKPARKRLSSGDSDNCRQNQDWVEFVTKSDSNDSGQKRLVSLRKMFSRKKARPVEPTLPGFSTPPATQSTQESFEAAVKNRDADLLLKLIHQNGDGDSFAVFPSTNVHKRNNPVELACFLGYYDILEVFLENGCSPNLPTSAGKLLHSVLESLKSHAESVDSGRKVLSVLINNGCDLNIKDRGGITPLMHCAQIGDSEIMKTVLEQCSSKQLTFQCSGSYTPLHMSSMRGDLACVKLLLSRSPHTHVNLKDKHNNTALHLALKSMLHNISYLNAAKERLGSCGVENSRETTATCQRLMQFQQNSVAIVEALLMAGADVHVACYEGSNTRHENFYPLVYALHLCALDNTQGFELDHTQFSTTLNLVSGQTIKSLEDLGKAERQQPEKLESKNSQEYCQFSPYAGVVRLLVLAGTQLSQDMCEMLYENSKPLKSLLDELCAFWDRHQVTRPPKLVHLSKLRVRSHLADIHRLHEISLLPVPSRIKEYLKLNCL